MTIIVGWVPKPEGDAALERAIYEAKLRGEDLVVLNNSSGAAYTDPSYASDEQLAAAEERLRASGVTYDIRHSIHGKEPADEVIRTAEEVGASMIIIGLRHRTAVGKFLLGSSAQQIILGAGRPVLAVPAPAGHRRAGH
jgi:nucleotide-binding universal stress UspA family protein